MDLFLTEFVAITTKLPAVVRCYVYLCADDEGAERGVQVACRCSPTQKADVARAIRAHTKARVACIGDGGNDVRLFHFPPPEPPIRDKMF